MSAPAPVLETTLRALQQPTSLLILGLVAAAAFVLFALPFIVTAPTDTAPPPRPAAAERAPTSNGPGNESGESPWSEARRTEARRALQDIIGEARSMAATLQSRGAERWDDPRLTRALGLMDRGDIAYAERDYRESESRYLLGLQALRDVLEDADQRVEAAVSRIRANLDAGRNDDVETDLNTIRRYRSDHPELDALRARANAWPRLQVLHRQALEDSAARDYAAAVAGLEQALALDARAEWLRDELGQARQSLRRQRFQASMSRGFRLLDQQQFDAAASAFESARPHQATANEASQLEQALAQVALLRTQSALQRRTLAAAAARAAGDWAGALDHYEAMLTIDSTLQPAQEGRQRMRMLVETLDTAERWFVDPVLLASDNARTQARSILDRWRAADSDSVQLAVPIQRLAGLLHAAETPVAVEVRSDRATDVVLLRHGQLGRFERQQLELLPGEYVFRGSRDGYRDVRVDLRIAPGQTGALVDVNCVERI